MGYSKESYIFVFGLIGFFAMFLGIFMDGGGGFVAIGSVFLLIALIIYMITTKKRNWKDFGVLLFGGVAASIVLVVVFKACNACTKPTHHDYPYHSVETGRGQYEYGGSEEQVKDIINADKYMTVEEKAREKEYEEQVERELKEMENY